MWKGWWRLITGVKSWLKAKKKKLNHFPDCTDSWNDDYIFLRVRHWKRRLCSHCDTSKQLLRNKYKLMELKGPFLMLYISKTQQPIHTQPQGPDRIELPVCNFSIMGDCGRRKMKSSMSVCVLTLKFVNNSCKPDLWEKTIVFASAACLQMRPCTKIIFIQLRLNWNVSQLIQQCCYICKSPWTKSIC